VVVQVVILAEDNDIREKLRQHDIVVQTIDEVAPIEVQPARVLSHLYTYLGELNTVLTPVLRILDYIATHSILWCPQGIQEILWLNYSNRGSWVPV